MDYDYDSVYPSPDSGTLFDSVTTYRSRSLQRLHNRRRHRNNNNDPKEIDRRVKLPEISIPRQEPEIRQLFGGSFLQNKARWRTRRVSCKPKPKKALSVEHLHLMPIPNNTSKQQQQQQQAMAVICLEEDLNRLALEQQQTGRKSVEAQSPPGAGTAPPAAPNPDLDLPPSYSELFGSCSQ